MLRNKFQKGWQSLSQDEKEDFVGELVWWFFIIVVFVFVVLVCNFPQFMLIGVLLIVFGLIVIDLLISFFKSLFKTFRTAYKIFQNGGGEQDEYPDEPRPISRKRVIKRRE